MVIEKLIVSSDDSARFLNFWPIVSESWNKLFNLSPTLVLVRSGQINGTFIKKLEKFGEVIILNKEKNIPISNQAKLARWYWACKSGEAVVSIEDIDTIFLKRNYLELKLKQFDHEYLLGIGNDTYKDAPKKFPASNLTGRGVLFSELFGVTENKSFGEFIHSFKDFNFFDSMENPFNSPQKFSDESLIRALRFHNNFEKIKLIPRGVDIRNEWLDRSWWPTNPPKTLDSFICVNFPRPMYENRKKIAFVLDVFFPKGYPWIIEGETSTFEKISWNVIRNFSPSFLRMLWMRLVRRLIRILGAKVE